MTVDVWIVGVGQLADFVTSDLTDTHTVICHAELNHHPPNARLALVLHDTWYPKLHHEMQKICQQFSIPWLGGYLSFGEGFVGPLVSPDHPGCTHCAINRLLMAGNDRKQMWNLYQWKIHAKDPHPDVWGTCTSIRHLAHLVTGDVQQILQGTSSHLKDKIRCLQLRTLQSSLHPLLPDPACTLCSQIPLDTAIDTQISLQPSIKIKPYVARTRSLIELNRFLTHDYLDTRTGCLNGSTKDTTTPFADAIVNLPLFTSDEPTAGRTLSFADSESAAILEGLERYCGLTARGKRTTVFEPYDRIKDDALHPIAVGVHSPTQYALPHFPFQPFDPQKSIHWVWGYSLIQNRPILVPESLAYYSLRHTDAYVYETSNGCALGGSLEEAIFYGLLEVVERDAFLMTWYGQLPLSPLDVASANDLDLLWMVERLRAVAGYDLHLFNATMEHGIPSIWALAKNRNATGLNLICAAGAHLDPIQAVKSAIHEIGGMVHLHTNQQQTQNMLTDPTTVRQMEDHSLLYGLPQAEERLHFLLQSQQPVQSLADLRWEIDPHDLTVDLKKMLTRFQKLNMDVIVVQQTAPELQRNNLYCVKVLIPGMLPMTFGHQLIRLTGLNRVLNVPMLLGYTTEPLTVDQLNAHPHPFP